MLMSIVYAVMFGIWRRSQQTSGDKEWLYRFGCKEINSNNSKNWTNKSAMKQAVGGTEDDFLFKFDLTHFSIASQCAWLRDLSDYVLLGVILIKYVIKFYSWSPPTNIQQMAIGTSTFMLFSHSASRWRTKVLFWLHYDACNTVNGHIKITVWHLICVCLHCLRAVKLMCGMVAK